jgi:hypothetical protein
LANGISDVAPDAGPVDIDSIPADNGALFIAHGYRAYLEPAIFSVEATKTGFCLGGFSSLNETPPPAFQAFEVIRVNGRFPPRSTHFLGRKTGVRMPLLVEEFYGTIRQKAPGKHWKPIDESAKLSFRFL